VNRANGVPRAELSRAAVAAWFESRVGRRLHVVVYVAGLPVATIDGPLRAGVVQAPATQDDGRVGEPPVVFAVGDSALALDDAVFCGGELVGESVAVRLRDGVEIVAFAWADAQ